MTAVERKTCYGIVTQYNWHDARWFAVIGFAPYLIAFAGMVTTNVSYFGWSFDIGSFLGLSPFIISEGMLMFAVYFIITMLFFAGGIEWYVLCRHCPCYEHSGVEHDNEHRFYCVGNWGSPKLFKYKPGQISRAGQATFLIFVGFFLFFPILYYIDSWSFILFQLTYAAIFATTLRHWACANCPNFGCVLNCVDEDSKEKFLKDLTEGKIYG